MDGRPVATIGSRAVVAMAVRPEPPPMPWPASPPTTAPATAPLASVGASRVSARTSETTPHTEQIEASFTPRTSRGIGSAALSAACALGAATNAAAAISAAAMVSRRRGAWALEVEAILTKAGCDMADSSCTRWLWMTKASATRRCSSIEAAPALHKVQLPGAASTTGIGDGLQRCVHARQLRFASVPSRHATVNDRSPFGVAGDATSLLPSSKA